MLLHHKMIFGTAKKSCDNFSCKKSRNDFCNKNTWTKKNSVNIKKKIMPGLQILLLNHRTFRYNERAVRYNERAFCFNETKEPKTEHNTKKNQKHIYISQTFLFFGGLLLLLLPSLLPLSFTFLSKLPINILRSPNTSKDPLFVIHKKVIIPWSRNNFIEIPLFFFFFLSNLKFYSISSLINYTRSGGHL